jgi:hypothetical protein
MTALMGTVPGMNRDVCKIMQQSDALRKQGEKSRQSSSYEIRCQHRTLILSVHLCLLFVF